MMFLNILCIIQLHGDIFVVETKKNIFRIVFLDVIKSKIYQTDIGIDFLKNGLYLVQY